MTRPKRHLCVVGDSDTISKYVPPMFSLIDHIPLLSAFVAQAHVYPSHPIRLGTPENVGIRFGLLQRETNHTKPAQALLRQAPRTSPVMLPSPFRWTTIVTQRHQHTDVHHRGSKFLKAWMGFLEENADLRYPNLSDVYVDERGGG